MRSAGAADTPWPSFAPSRAGSSWAEAGVSSRGRVASRPAT
ncbi:putative sensor-like histidine kinase [Streptomyces sp. Tu6071]|nr:putative sensor-like histidine kinase [Streptomyces sp. Tu6071]